MAVRGPPAPAREGRWAGEGATEHSPERSVALRLRAGRHREVARRRRRRGHLHAAGGRSGGEERRAPLSEEGPGPTRSGDRGRGLRGRAPPARASGVRRCLRPDRERPVAEARRAGDLGARMGACLPPFYAPCQRPASHRSAACRLRRTMVQEQEAAERSREASAGPIPLRSRPGTCLRMQARRGRRSPAPKASGSSRTRHMLRPPSD